MWLIPLTVFVMVVSLLLAIWVLSAPSTNPSADESSEDLDADRLAASRDELRVAPDRNGSGWSNPPIAPAGSGYGSASPQSPSTSNFGSNNLGSSGSGTGGSGTGGSGTGGSGTGGSGSGNALWDDLEEQAAAPEDPAAPVTMISSSAQSSAPLNSAETPSESPADSVTSVAYAAPLPSAPQPAALGTSGVLNDLQVEEAMGSTIITTQDLEDLAWEDADPETDALPTPEVTSAHLRHAPPGRKGKEFEFSLAPPKVPDALPSEEEVPAAPPPRFEVRNRGSSVPPPSRHREPVVRRVEEDQHVLTEDGPGGTEGESAATALIGPELYADPEVELPPRPSHLPAMDFSRPALPGPLTDQFEFSLTAPAIMSPGSAYLLDVWAHLREQSRLVEELATLTFHQQEVRLMSKKQQITVGDLLLTACLRIDGLRAEDPEDCLLWQGTLANASFLVNVPARTQIGLRPGTLSLHLAGLRIARLDFELQVGPRESPPIRLFSRVSRYRKIYVSHAPDDAEEVQNWLEPVRAVTPNIEFFTTQERLEKQLPFPQDLPRRDALCLFWSQAAESCPEVQREWRYALTQRGPEFLDLAFLADPSEVPLPLELAPLFEGRAE